MKFIKIKSPATIANLGAGFDVFGIALKQPYDIIEAEVTDSGNVEIEVSGHPVPIEPRKNTGGYVAIRMFEKFKIKEGLRIKINKQIIPAVGIGSSSATAAGVAYCINKLFNLNLSTTELIQYASYGEIISAGDPHADNVSAAILGGFTIVHSSDPFHCIQCVPPKNMGIVVAIPSGITKGSTRLVRESLPREVPLQHFVFNLSYGALFAAGMASKNLEWIKRGMQDFIIEPARNIKYGMFKLLPNMRKIGLEMNAGIAGAGGGPAIIGIIEKERTKELAKRMKEEFELYNYPCETIITEAGNGIQEI